LLTSGPSFEGRPLQPRDVAVIAYRNNDLQKIQAALAELGIPAVVAGSGSVFATPAATEWLQLLEGLEQPHRSGRVRSAALTSFFGYDAEQLDADADHLTDYVAQRLRDWADLLADRGVAGVLEAAVTAGMTARVLSTINGERQLTDLRHLGQSLHQQATEHRLGLVALIGWLRSQMADDKVEVASERTRRLDSDAAAVQLVTIHGSKGLEYPVVYLPTLWDRYLRAPDVPLFHSPATDGVQRCIDIGGDTGAHWQANLTQSALEDDGESLRLLYVAMTRAQSQVVAWWAPAPKNTPASALQRMLFGRRPRDAQVKPSQPLHSEDDVARILDLIRQHGGASWEASRILPADEEPLPVDNRPLDARRFTRVVDTSWRRTSYTAISSAAASVPTAAVGSEAEEQPRDDEPDLSGVLTEPRRPSSDALVSPMRGLPAGASFGSLVHAVLEHADPDAADIHSEFRTQILRQVVRWPVNLDPDELAAALVTVCDSPLGPLADGATLRNIPMRDRLCEMDFELPLAGGDVRGYPATRITLAALAAPLEQHLPDGDPVRGYADVLRTSGPAGRDLRGYLNGSLDVVLRLARATGPRYLVVDYKTNWLGDLTNDETSMLTSSDYHPDVLAQAMRHSDYPLQALLYAVVLHRFLRWRQPGYEPAVHFGGVLYLYLRGMCGPDTPIYDGSPCGVFSWQPPVRLLDELSDVLDGRASGTGAE
jgi:exodeoxyribonuclease V beta subunit